MSNHDEICLSIRGSGLSVQDVIAALSQYSKKTVTETDSPKSGEIGVSRLKSATELNEALAAKDKELKELEATSSKALISIQVFHKQQQSLFDEFVLLRQKYDEQKAVLVSVLWNQCSQFHPELRQIPSSEHDETFVENDERLGKYTVGDVLGEGQFAIVRECWKDGGDKPFALKIINKDRITTFAMLKRISNEIFALRSLRSEFVVHVTDVIHTKTRLYIITEKGGCDMFEFFDKHPDGVPEEWARSITVMMLKAVLFCHEQRICHRDLKPENILVHFDSKSGRCVDLKLCDFGLSSVFQSKVLLTDFCGSPGFFAPEMIVHGSYFGDKADVWSVGCILLELVLGHDRFCEAWMSAYDYEILHDKEAFLRAIEGAVQALPSYLTFSEHLNDFIVKFLCLKSSDRPHIRTVCLHPWMGGELDSIVAPPKAKSIEQVNVNIHSPQQKSADGAHTEFSPSQAALSPDHRLLDVHHAHVSEKERRAYAQDGLAINLPPVTPGTPNLGNARRILRRGEAIASHAAAGDFELPLDSPDGRTSPSPRQKFKL